MKYIRVKAKYLSPYIRDLVGLSEEVVTVEEGSSVKDVIMKIAEIHGKHVLAQLLDDSERDLRGGVVVLVNNTTVQDINHKIQDNDTLVFLIALNGG